MTKPASKYLPALSENAPLRYVSFAILYLAQGIPEGMTYFGIPAWLAMNGRSAADIGSYVAVIGIPWTFKMLIAPKLLPWTKGVASEHSLMLHLPNWWKIFSSLGRVIIMPYSLLILVISFSIGTAVSYMNTLLPVFTVQALGWTNEMYSTTNAVSSVGAGVLGVVIGGTLLDRFGKVRMLSAYLVLAITVATIMFLSKRYWNIHWFSTSFLVLYNVLYVFIMVGILAIAMEMCWKKVSASQFTFLKTETHRQQLNKLEKAEPQAIAFVTV